MKHYGKFTQSEQETEIGKILVFKNGDLDFYDLQAEDITAKREEKEDYEPHFDQPFYFVTDESGRISCGSSDISQIVPNGDLWGGEVEPAIIENSTAYIFDGEAFALFVPENWKADAFDDVRQARDNLLALITDPNETVQGKIAWAAKSDSAEIILQGKEALAARFGLPALPPKIEAAFEQTKASMEFLATVRGQSLQEFAIEVSLGKKLGFSALVWLADEKTARAWQAIEALPDNAEGFAMLEGLEKQLRAEAEATAKAAKSLLQAHKDTE